MPCRSFGTVLSAGLLLLKKFGVFLLLGLSAFWRKIKALFSGDKSTDYASESA